MSRASKTWEQSPRATAMHELMDLSERCAKAPGDERLIRELGRLSARLAPVLVQRLRVLETEVQELRDQQHAAAE